MNDWFEAEAHADRALEMYERGRWAEAEAELRKALSLNPDHAEWHFNLGLTLEAAGRDVEALASYERVLDLEPESLEALVAAGILCGRMDRLADALRWHEQALKLDPRCEAAYSHKIDCLTRLGRHDEAETAFYLAQQALPEPSPSCLAVIAESLMQRQMFERAEWCFQEALRLEPHMPRLRARLAAVYAATGRHQRALHMYIRDLRDDPGNLDTLLDLGELLMEVGRLPESAEKFRRVLEIEPANVDAHFRLGQVALASRRFEQAHLEFELVFKLDSTFPQIRMAIAESLLGLGRLEEARACLREELNQFNQPEPAEGQADAALRPAPAKFGSLLLDADLPSDASAMFERALADLAPGPAKRRQRADLLRQLALARYRAGDRDAGSVASRRVLRLEPECVVSIHNLALAALDEGRLDVAAGWIKRGLRVNRHDDGLRRLRMKLWLISLQRLIQWPWQITLAHALEMSREIQRRLNR